MQSLTDDERREVLGEVLFDELQAIREYVQDIPKLKQKVYDMDDRLNSIDERLIVIEHVVKTHETDSKELKQALAS